MAQIVMVQGKWACLQHLLLSLLAYEKLFIVTIAFMDLNNDDVPILWKSKKIRTTDAGKWNKKPPNDDKNMCSLVKN